MRYRSILAFLCIAIAGASFVGCGSSNNNSNYVLTTPAENFPTTGDLVFNFVQAQAAFTVSANTDTLVFKFYDGVSSEPVLRSTQEYANTITIKNVPVSAQTVVITGYDVNKFPLFTITQAIDVEAGATTTVNGFTSAEPVTLSTLRLAPGNLAQLDQTLTQVNLEVNGTGQVFLFAEFSNGDRVIVGNQATYTILPVGSTVAEVDEFGTLRGLSVGQADLEVSFGGQSITVPVVVSDSLTVNFSSIDVVNAEPILVTSGTPVLLELAGTRASDGVVFGLNAANPALSYTINNPLFTVDASGHVNVDATVPAGTQTLLTVTYNNPGSAPVTDQVILEAN